MGSNDFHHFAHGHNDMVLAVAYNLYGDRMATASSDHTVKVWDRDESDKDAVQWIVSDSWTAHDAEVTDVKWNGPFIGAHIGTIGEDGLIRIWQEDVHEPVRSGRRFKKIFQLVTPTGVPFMSLDFKNIGPETYLAVATRDGHIVICEPENHDSLSAWRALWSDALGKTPSRTEETGFRLSWHQEKLPAWPAVLAGLDRKALSLAAAVGSSVRIFRTDKDRKFYIAASLDGAKDLIRDVSWADGSMRGFDTIATASKDGFVRIYELHTPGASSLPKSSHLQKPGTDEHPTAAKQALSGIGAGLAGGARGKRDERSDRPGAVMQDAKLVFEQEAHGGAPWRVTWSQLGEVLVSTGDDGTVRLWKKGIEGKWLEAAEIDATRSK